MNNQISDFWFNVPEEMKPFANWGVYGAPGAVGDAAKVAWSAANQYRLDSMDPSSWTTYQKACEFANAHNFAGLSFVLSTRDPFAGIDLDNPNGDSSIVSAQTEIFNNFQSYAEISSSGQGLHIIVIGDVPRGRRRNKIEVYSKGRYFNMTGNVYRKSPIIACQAELTRLYQALGGDSQAVQILDAYHPQETEDDILWERAANARNGEKFRALWEGRWHHIYPTQSEADFALVDILAFYSKNREQIVRMYQASGLTHRTYPDGSPKPAGDQGKAFRPDHLEWMLSRVFDRMLPPVDLSFIQSELKLALEEAKAQQTKIKPVMKIIPELEEPAHTFLAWSEEPDEEEGNPFTPFPPGLIGEIAQFTLSVSPLPVPEIALATAIGLMAGVCGKAYNVNKIGLNQFILILARTGRGKETVSTSINYLMSTVSKLFPDAAKFVGPGDFRSDQALVKYLDSTSKSFVTIAGEFGLALKEMSGPAAAPHKVGYRKILLDLYNKSGQHSVLAPTVYSEREKNTRRVKAPAVTLLGESAQKHFYEALDEGMIAEGLVSRFLIIEYKGDRVAHNYEMEHAAPSPALVQSMASLCHHASTMNRTDQVYNIPFACEHTASIAKTFNEECTRIINGDPTDEIGADLWARAYLKTLKLAALCAVGINPMTPTICPNCWEWARRIIVWDIRNIVRRFERGEVGASSDERVQLHLTRKTIVEYFLNVPRKLGKVVQHVPNIEQYHAEAVIPYNYLYRKLVSHPAFRKGARMRPTDSIKACIQTLIELGDIAPLSLVDREKRFGRTAAAYILTNVDLLKAK